VSQRPPRPTTTTEPWTTRIVPLPDVGDVDVRRWKRLADRAIEPNVYLDPRFLAPAGARPDAQDIRLVFVERGDDLLGVFQFSLGRLENRWPVRVATTGGGFMSVHADRHHPLIAPDDPGETVRRLLLALRGPGIPRMLLFRYLPADGPLGEAFASAFRALGYRTTERSRRESAFAEGRGAQETAAEIFDFSHLSSSRAKAYRRRVRGLERDAGGAPLALSDRRDDPAVLEDFLAFQAAGWKGDRDKGGGAFILDPVHERWYRAVTRAFAEDGALLAPTLTVGEEVVFQALDFVSGGAAFGFIDAYNEKYASHGPGTLGRIAELGYITTRTDATHFDPAFDPRYSESTKLYPDRRDHRDVLAGRGPFAALVVAALPLARRVRDRLRRRG
jgi:CelD/BcsL family acetyltransferase involved in cellulose biosynthesis